MSRGTYRTSTYRGVYAIGFVGAYLLLVAYLSSGDDSGSIDNVGVWLLMLGLATVFIVGALAGPALHRRLFKRAAAHRSHHGSQRKPRNKHSNG
jgi:peptidoglycan/LPS O-acetylase OafA/YrhL